MNFEKPTRQPAVLPKGPLLLLGTLIAVNAGVCLWGFFHVNKASHAMNRAEAEARATRRGVTVKADGQVIGTVSYDPGTGRATALPFQ